jgi:hypothetical protein
LQFLVNLGHVQTQTLNHLSCYVLVQGINKSIIIRGIKHLIRLVSRINQSPYIHSVQCFQQGHHHSITTHKGTGESHNDDDDAVHGESRATFMMVYRAERSNKYIHSQPTVLYCLLFISKQTVYQLCISCLTSPRAAHTSFSAPRTSGFLRSG